MQNPEKHPNFEHIHQIHQLVSNPLSKDVIRPPYLKSKIITTSIQMVNHYTFKTTAQVHVPWEHQWCHLCNIWQPDRVALVPQMLAGLLSPVNNTRHLILVTPFFRCIEKNTLSCMHNLDQHDEIFESQYHYPASKICRDNQSKKGKTWVWERF